MKLAEQCGTSPSYIGEIEIGRKFPSVEMIDKIAKALQLEPYRLFVDTADSGKDKPVEITDFLNDLPDDIKKELFNRLISGINDSIARILTPNQGGPESN